MSQTKFNYPSIFNPGSQSDSEIVSNFVIRLPEFQELFNAIKRDKMLNPPQHFMIQGQRGYGKTTLLLRVNIEIKNDKELTSQLIPVMFDEEQYSVRTLAKLWEEVIDILEYENESFRGMSGQIDSLYDTDSPEENIFNFLISELKKHDKKIVLLLDNFGDMIQKFTKKENQRLREVLITCNHIRLIGASSTILEFYYDYKQPFYDFFKVITLDELDKVETILLLKKLGETYKSDEINRIIDKQPERIEALRRLTGGVPRTIMILYQIFVDDETGNSINDLETLLDKVTPLYKHRLDNLSTQQQAIIDAIAQNWDAISTKEISQTVRMESKAVSSQLKQLEKSQLIKKIKTSTKNYLYQVNERFFNIYYLMRLGKRKNRNKVLWLVKFLETWCDMNELVSRANKHLNALQKNMLNEKYVYFMSESLARMPIPLELQDDLLKKTRVYLDKAKSEFATELSKSHLEILGEVDRFVVNDDIESAFQILKEDGVDEGSIYFIIGDSLRTELSNFNRAEKHYLMAVEKRHVQSMFNLALLYENEFKDFEKAEKYYLMAVEKGHAGAMNNLAALYQIEFKDFQKAEKYYLMAMEKKYINAMFNLALLHENEFKNFEKAEKYYLMAIERGHNSAMFNLALMYQIEFKDFEKAEKYYLMAIERDDDSAMFNLALMYQIKFKDFQKAEKYYSMAIKYNHIKSMVNLASNYFLSRTNPEIAFELCQKAYNIEENSHHGSLYATILLWNNKFIEAFEVANKFLADTHFIGESYELVIHFFNLLLAKKQYNYALKKFSESNIELKEKFSPVYYVLLKLLGLKYTDEFKKMPPELTDTVEEILVTVKQWEKDYAL